MNEHLDCAGALWRELFARVATTGTGTRVYHANTLLSLRLSSSLRLSCSVIFSSPFRTRAIDLHVQHFQPGLSLVLHSFAVWPPTLEHMHLLSGSPGVHVNSKPRTFAASAHVKSQSLLPEPQLCVHTPLRPRFSGSEHKPSLLSMVVFLSWHVRVSRLHKVPAAQHEPPQHEPSTP